MKARVETREVERVVKENREVTVYTCDEPNCTFTTESSHEASRHIFDDHSHTGRAHIDGHDYYQFDSKERFLAFANNSRHLDECSVHTSFVAPGWYQLDSTTCYGPWQAERTCLKLIPAQRIANEAHDLLKELAYHLGVSPYSGD